MKRGGPFLAWNVLPAQFSRNRKAIIPVLEDLRTGLGRGSLTTQQDRWWLAIWIVWLFLTLGMLLYVGFA
jgi:hypothetical protein